MKLHSFNVELPEAGDALAPVELETVQSFRVVGVIHVIGDEKYPSLEEALENGNVLISFRRVEGWLGGKGEQPNNCLADVRLNCVTQDLDDDDIHEGLKDVVGKDVAVKIFGLDKDGKPTLLTEGDDHVAGKEETADE